MEIKFSVPDMSCGHCTATIEKAVKHIDPTAEVSTDLASRTVIVSSERDATAVQAALRDAGYPATQA